MVRPRDILTLLLLMVVIQDAAGQQPQLRHSDRIRVAEVFHLADAIQEMVWEDWSSVPFVILLVTPGYEFLFRHPYPPDEFASLGFDEQLGSEVRVRPNSGQYPLNFLATFPAIRGVNTVVIGQPENTDKDSTLWVIVAMHEHFHQLQYTRPWYYDSVAALELDGGDDSGMWQLNYPFPYEDVNVAEAFARYVASLQDSLGLPGGSDDENFRRYRAARTALREQLGDSDYRYLSFQLWQEGIARYTEYQVAETAALHHEPLPEFMSLADFKSYAEAARVLKAMHAKEMSNLDIRTGKRTVFYPVGASEGLLLDKRNPAWKSRYFAEPFFVERYYDRN